MVCRTAVLLILWLIVVVVLKIIEYGVHAFAWVWVKLERLRGSAPQASKPAPPPEPGQSPFASPTHQVPVELPTDPNEAVMRIMKVEETDLYAVLGGTFESSANDLKRLFRRQSLLVHPDKNKSQLASEAFKRLSVAYEVLGDEESRASYDKQARMAGQTANLVDELLTKLRKSKARRRRGMMCDRPGCRDDHERVPVERSLERGRYCETHNAFHLAREGDLWCETETGLVRSYTRTFLCLEKRIWDVTDWARCMKYDEQLPSNAHKAASIDLRSYRRMNQEMNRAENMMEAFLEGLARGDFDPADLHAAFSPR